MSGAAAGLPTPLCAMGSADAMAATHGGCEDARRMFFSLQLFEVVV